MFYLLTIFYWALNTTAHAQSCSTPTPVNNNIPLNVLEDYVPDEYSPELSINLYFHFLLNDDVFDPHNLTAIGFIYTNTGTGPQGGYVQDIFLLTVDQDGCVVPNCGVSVREWEPEEEQPVLYPNPSAGFSAVRLASPAVAQWQVYDGRRALVLSGEQEHRQQIDLQGQSLVPGLYHVRITQADKVYTLPWMVTSR